MRCAGLLHAAAALAVSNLLSGGIHAGEWPHDCEESTLPSDDPRYPDDQLILTCLPSNFNGDLIVYAHGYVRPQEALELPAEELGNGEVRELIKVLLGLGYGVATSSYHKNGYAVEQAEADLNQLVALVKAIDHHVDNVWVIGASEGGLIATELVEQYPEAYSGGLALCGPLAGMNYQVRYLTDFRVVFDFYFPEVFPFGALDAPEDAPEHWRGRTGFEAAIADAVKDDPRSTEQTFEVARMACHASRSDEAANCAQDVLAYGVFGVHDLMEVAEGSPYRNLTRIYTGSDDDAALNAGVERLDSDQQSQSYVRDYYRPSGRLRRPLVTMHTVHDPIVPYRHELRYFSRVRMADRDRYLTSLPVDRDGHCAFKTDDVLGALGALFLRSDRDLPSELLEALVSLADIVDLHAVGGRIGDMIRDQVEHLLDEAGELKDLLDDAKDKLDDAKDKLDDAKDDIGDIF